MTANHRSPNAYDLVVSVARTDASTRARSWQRRLAALGAVAWLTVVGSLGFASSFEHWQAWSGPEAGFNLLLPPTHDIGNSDRIWYVHGFIDGDPTVPDMSIRFRPGTTLEQALAELSDDVLVEWVRLGTDTPARRATARHDGLHGPYVSSWYLVPAPDGVYEIRGWENLFWELFHHVAITFTVERP